MKDSLIRYFDELDIIEYFKDEKKKLASGRESNYFINAKKLFTDLGAIKTVTNLAIAKIIYVENENKCGYNFAGVYVGGFLFGTHVGMEIGRPVVNVDHKKHRVGGKINTDYDYLFFEDVTTTGGSIIESQELLGEYGAKVTRAICIVDREEGAIENLANHGIILDPILIKSELGINID